MAGGKEALIVFSLAVAAVVIWKGWFSVDIPFFPGGQATAQGYDANGNYDTGVQ